MYDFDIKKGNASIIKHSNTTIEQAKSIKMKLIEAHKKN